MILSEDSGCSRFYGGAPAIEVLNELVKRLKPAYFEPSLALRMKGELSYGYNHSTGLNYRLFESELVNTNGPFYKTSISPLDRTIQRVGEFSPNTREARLTILLHELGHMVLTP